MWAVVFGNCVTGITLQGPFDDNALANEYAAGDDIEGIVVPLQPPPGGTNSIELAIADKIDKLNVDLRERLARCEQLLAGGEPMAVVLRYSDALSYAIEALRATENVLRASNAEDE